MADVKLNQERVNLVFGKLVEAMLSGADPYAGGNSLHKYLTPKALFPENICDKKHALFLFTLCFYMRGMDSVVAAKALSVIFAGKPQLFDPAYLDRLGETEGVREIFEALSSANALKFQAKSIAYYWFADLIKLRNFWNGNPTNLIVGCASYEDLCDRMIYRQPRLKGRDENNPDGLHGFGKKMVSMFLYLLVATGFDLGDFVRDDRFPIPADFHAVRIFLSTGCITCENSVKNGDLLAVQELIREASLETSASLGVSVVNLADCTWVLSRDFCERRPGNNGGSDSHLAGFSGKCAICPIKEHCLLDVPAQGYYERKEVICYPRANPLLNEIKPPSE